jgi:hypothetical protein
MFDLSFLFTIYLFLTAVSVVMTYIESSKNIAETKSYRFLGFLLCFVWPLGVLVVFAINAYGYIVSLSHVTSLKAD